MQELNYVEGDATDPVGDGPRIIAHVCNDIGAWGRGIVRVISRRWPEPEREFRRWHGEPTFRLGAVQLVPVAPELWVANMVGQHGIATRRGLRTESGYEADAGPPVRYEAIRECLTTLAAHARTEHASVHMPRIGCGLAGGTWAEIEPRIRETLCAQDVPTVVYDLKA
ncbi:macro domain-containing protein [Catenuloplanes indicus]|uniref:O-acetyl-ADP-ribose deacetylase (Regulator of RNase III) n=1 Tax=Catenuloplanes indicus TaxID=137267 RepID=A0AAE3VTE4_9ACTN|nr:macro domain-containing protein [Catenuloplanes indicus]MDQ0363501.1 O-acetyl-ADP-ribose deacetylase (regulator of RNase III) [Catenuloplanes indicus]